MAVNRCGNLAKRIHVLDNRTESSKSGDECHGCCLLNHELHWNGRDPVVMNAMVAVCSGNCTFPSGDHAGECKSTALAIPYSLTQVTDKAIHSNAGPNGHKTIDGRISKCNA